jgi:hypothetical protein
MIVDSLKKMVNGYVFGIRYPVSGNYRLLKKDDFLNFSFMQIPYWKTHLIVIPDYITIFKEKTPKLFLVQIFLCYRIFS